MDADTESVSSSGVDGGTSSVATNDSGGGGTSRSEPVTIRIRIPDLNVENTLQFQSVDLIWDVKQQCLAAIPKELQESFNYGLFYPPSNGKAGKFLDEERRLSEYPFQGPVGYLELKYKRRVYKMLQMDEKQLKSMNSRANHKKIVDHINAGNVEKVNKMLTKGLDPNFHCHDSGETPLCLAAGHKGGKSSLMIIALINGGAILDFRTKDGSTALHRAVLKNNSKSVKTLLDLGASPNYKDGRGLTPLYHGVAASSDVGLLEILLHDHAVVGIQDRQEWQEVHHTCRNGLVQHLEHLLFYSADINARNASGNTPLHVCAVNNQESCARILLFRGCETEALNYAGQTPYQVAVIAGNLELAEIIRNHRAEDIVPFKNAPKFNPRRRTSASSSLSRTASDASMCQTPGGLAGHPPPTGPAYQPVRMESPLVNSLRSNSSGGGKQAPSSPSPSDRSLPPFSSGGSSVSETTSTGSGASSVQHQEGDHHHLHHHPEVEDEHLDSASTLAASMVNNDHPRCDSVSLSSGVGTSSQSGSSGSAATPTSDPSSKATVLHPGIHVVCVETFVSPDEGSLKINTGDIIQVTGSTDDGRLEGILRGQSGYFPAGCTQEVRLRNPESLGSPPITSTPAPGSRILGRRELRENNRPYQHSSNRFMGLEPRTALLHKGKKGFGFVLRGAKAASPLMDIIPSDKCPGLQYMDDVDPEGVADLAGINKGDFLIAINGEDVTQASHETVVNLIRKSGDRVSLTIVTINVDHIRELEKNNSLVGSPASISKARAYSTLPRKMQGRSLLAPPPPPKRDPSTTLSVGRARARSMVANLAALEVLDRAINEHDAAESNKGKPSLPSPSSPPPTATGASSGRKFSPSNSAGTPSQARGGSPLKEEHETSTSYQQASNAVSAVLRKDFFSTPALNGRAETEESQKDHVEERKIHSEEDINKSSEPPEAPSNQAGYFTLPSKGKQKKSLEIHDGYRTLTKIRPVVPSASTKPPPPEHPPPPPPALESKSGSSPDYAKVERKPSCPTSPPPDSSPLSPSNNPGGVMSSFKPSDNAKLYASPETIHALGYRIPQKHNSPLNGPIHDPINGITSVTVGPSTSAAINNNANNNNTSKKSPSRANSMPPRPKPLLVKKIEEPPAAAEEIENPPAPPPPPPVETSETYKINGVKYTTYTTFRSPLTPDDEDDIEEEGEENAVTPEIPEPDYYSDGEERRASASTMTSCTTLEKKKKKSVSFVIDEGGGGKVVGGAAAAANKSARPGESILKDPHKELPSSSYVVRASPALMSASFSEGSDHQKAVIPQGNHPPSMHRSLRNEESPPPANNKVRIDVGNRMTKSQSFCSDKSSSPPGCESVKSSSPPKKAGSSPPKSAASGGGGGSISVHDIKAARSSLKPSRSFPNEFSVPEDGGDNSSSGVSSDQEQVVVISSNTLKTENESNAKYVTYLPVEGPRPASSSSSSNNKSSTTSGQISGWENDSESSDDVSDKSWVLRAEKDSSTGSNIISMKKMLHPKLAALFDVPNSGIRTLPNLKHHHHIHNNGNNILEAAARLHLKESSEASPPILSKSKGGSSSGGAGSSNNGGGRSIEESLALIQKHVSSLGDVPLGVPPPPSKTEIVVPEVLAPPPGFSDSDSNYSDNDGLSAEQKRKKANKAALKKVMSRSMDYTTSSTRPSHHHRSSSVNHSPLDYSTLPRNHFKSKSLPAWSVSDVCEWLDSLIMSEYKSAFLQNRIDGRRLLSITKVDLEKLGVHRVGHMLNIERSLKKYAASISNHHHGGGGHHHHHHGGGSSSSSATSGHHHAKK